MIIIKYDNKYQDYGIVERKGLGHPDTLADGIAEYVSIKYSLYCLEKFGVVLHHNLDKVYVKGGLANTDYNKSNMPVKANIYINGRISNIFNGVDIDTDSICTEAAREYIQKILPACDVDNEITIMLNTTQYSHNEYWYKPRGIKDVPDHEKQVSNDTSTCFSYWPLRAEEEVALLVEKYFYNQGKTKDRRIGQDTKVMVARDRQNVSITTCVPLISRFVNDISEHRKIYAEAKLEILNLLHEKYPDFVFEIEMHSENYLLHTGSCIEAGEEGVVGRGNKARGIISANRKLGMEAPHGKNPVYHVGKVYQYLSDELSRVLYEKFHTPLEVGLTGSFGHDIRDPKIVSVIFENAVQADERDVSNTVQDFLKNVEWTKEILNGHFIPKI